MIDAQERSDIMVVYLEPYLYVAAAAAAATVV